jgi:ribosomal protein L11 methyltransferase
MPRSSLETRVDVPIELAELMANRLFEIGSPGLASEDAGVRTRLIAYFDTEKQVNEVRTSAKALSASIVVESTRIGDEDWAENWKEHFRPVAVGEKLYVCPPWAVTPPHGRIAVVIDPGMAFGTGHHTTTRACLELIEHFLTSACDVLDIGTGSGVLAIAALQLGARSAVGVDVDPLAITAALANGERNCVVDRMAACDSLAKIEQAFDLVVANIQLNTLCELEERVATLVKPGGTWIVSGLLRSELSSWYAHIAERWTPGLTRGDDEWVAVALTPRVHSARHTENSILRPK